MRKNVSRRNPTMKKLLALVMALCMLCGVAVAETAQEGVYTYNSYLTLSPSNWNELTYQDNNDTEIMGYIGGSFFTYDFKFDDKTDMAKDLIRILGREYVGHAVVAPKAFVKIVH